MKLTTPLADLIDVLERLLTADLSECLALPGHESSCECANHVRVRAIADEAKEVLARVKGS